MTAKTARTTRARKSKIVAAPLLLTYRPAGVAMLQDQSAHVADFTHERDTLAVLEARALETVAYEERLAALTETFSEETFSEETVGEMCRRITNADETPFEILTPVEDDLDAALDSLTLDASDDLEAEVLETEAQELSGKPEDAPVSFREKMLSFSEDQVAGMTMRVSAAIDARSAFETAKHGESHNIHKTLNKVRKQLMWKDTSRVLLAAQVDPAFINRVLHDGSCYNVYAIDKVADAIKGLADGVVSNAINRACMVSLFQMKKAGQPFTGEVAKACASDKHHIDLAIRKHLLRHTVSASTAPTQASSTMQALETLGIVKREGTTRNPTFQLNDSPIVERLQEVLFAKAA